MIIKCTKCNLSKEVVLLKKYFRQGTSCGANSVYVDVNGKKSLNNVCYECRTTLRRSRQEVVKVNKRKKRQLKIKEKKDSKELIKKAKCSSCSKIFDVSFVKWFFFKGKKMHPVYSQLNGYSEMGNIKTFVSNQCFDCRKSIHDKKLGRVRREHSTRPQTVAAVGAEKIAQRRFEDLGFSVKRVNVIGPDLTCRIGGLEYTVEVKRATHGSRSWKVAQVRPKRKCDDLVAIVLPNEYVYIDSMKNHLESCSRGGTRTVSSIVKQFGLNPLPQATK